MRLCLLLLLLWSPGTSASIWDWIWGSGSGEAVPDLSVSCRDENGKKVDWYILYKAPDGQRYIYISTNGEVKTNKNIGDPKGVLAHSLTPLLEDNLPKSFKYRFYSDQPPPDGKSVADTYGHSKGVVLQDEKTALWLTHSTPRFPFKEKDVTVWKRDTFWPQSANKNGQTFMCVNFELNQLNVLGNHLQNINAFVFGQRNTGIFPEDVSEAADEKDEARTLPVFQNLKVKNKNFLVVAKGKDPDGTAAGGDLYVQLSTHFNSEIYAKTWGCGPNKDKSYCEPNKHKVLSVTEVKTGLGDWSWTKDHSKWAITTDNNIHWTCIADMNRAPSQYRRPGGALCIEDETVKSLFNGFKDKLLACGVDPSRKRPIGCEDDPDVDSLSDDFQEMNLNERVDL